MTELAQANDAYVEETESASFLRDTVRIFRRNRMAMTGLIIIVVLVLTAVFAPYISPHDPYRVDMNEQFLSPSLSHTGSALIILDGTF